MPASEATRRGEWCVCRERVRDLSGSWVCAYKVTFEVQPAVTKSSSCFDSQGCLQISFFWGALGAVRGYSLAVARSSRSAALDSANQHSASTHGPAFTALWRDGGLARCNAPVLQGCAHHWRGRQALRRGKGPACVPARSLHSPVVQRTRGLLRTRDTLRPGRRPPKRLARVASWLPLRPALAQGDEPCVQAECRLQHARQGLQDAGQRDRADQPVDCLPHHGRRGVRARPTPQHGPRRLSPSARTPRPSPQCTHKKIRPSRRAPHAPPAISVCAQQGRGPLPRAQLRVQGHAAWPRAAAQGRMRGGDPHRRPLAAAHRGLRPAYGHVGQAAEGAAARGGDGHDRPRGRPGAAQPRRVLGCRRRRVGCE